MTMHLAALRYEVASGTIHTYIRITHLFNIFFFAPSVSVRRVLAYTLQFIPKIRKAYVSRKRRGLYLYNINTVPVLFVLLYVSGRHSSLPLRNFIHISIIYNHARRLCLEKLLYIELSRSSNGYFKPLLDPGGGFTSASDVGILLYPPPVHQWP
jgi:hypothetical protein